MCNVRKLGVPERHWPYRKCRITDPVCPLGYRSGTNAATWQSTLREALPTSANSKDECLSSRHARHVLKRTRRERETKQDKKEIGENAREGWHSWKAGYLCRLDVRLGALYIGHGSRPPVEAPRQSEASRDEQSPHHEGVHQYAEDHREAHLGEEGIAVLGDHPTESQGHDHSGRGYDGACGRNSVDDGGAVLDKLSAFAVCVDPGEEEYVVVQSKSDEHEGASHGVDPHQAPLALQAGDARPLQEPVLEDEDARPQDGQYGQGNGE
mmetsp:Transcript_53331/g.165331  ORF Transcript_53331/g.165331 Transcript_53331/m.165331 type:complete len:267 (+) Transcript_53331:90-890(+)